MAASRRRGQDRPEDAGGRVVRPMRRTRQRRRLGTDGRGGARRRAGRQLLDVIDAVPSGISQAPGRRVAARPGLRLGEGGRPDLPRPLSSRLQDLRLPFPRRTASRPVRGPMVAARAPPPRRARHVRRLRRARRRTRFQGAVQREGRRTRFRPEPLGRQRPAGRRPGRRLVHRRRLPV